MRRPEVRRALTLLTLAGFLAACASPRSVVPIETLGEAFEPPRDETRLWESARAEEQKLLKEAELYDDPLLEDYLGEVLAGLGGSGLAGQERVSPRIRILADPALNAFAYPHGSIYLHTGLLARLENEDQLAGVLGHELTHVDERHMLRFQRSARRKSIGFTLAALAASVIVAKQAGDAAEAGNYSDAYVIGQVANILLGLGLQLAFIAAINGHGRDLERAADAGAVRRMQRAGYRPEELQEVFDHLLDDHGDGTKLETFFFGSHPRLRERKADTDALLADLRGEVALAPAAAGEAPARDPARFDRRLRPVLKDDARLNLAVGRYRLAEDEVHRALAIVPADPDALVLLGRIRLKRAEAHPDEAEKLRDGARSAFLRAVEADPDFAPAHRELGLLAFRSGDRPAACEHFRRYLELDPKAEEAKRIRDYELELRSGGDCP